MLVNCNLHNLSNLVINKVNEIGLFALVNCEEFKMIRRPQIIIDELLSYDDRTTKQLTDIFNAFPDVSFTLEHCGDNISAE